MSLQANISDWSAWAPGLTSTSDWQKYFAQEKETDLELKPDVSELPPMFRRRLSSLNRMIFAAADGLEDKNVLNECPVVFASRHGELNLSLKLINSIISRETVSPAGFSMSVHNSAAGLISIHHGNTSAATSIAAGEASLKMGLIEAISQVQKFNRVLLIFADEMMPEIYRNFNNSQKYPSCLLLTVAKKPGKHVIDTSGDCTFEGIVNSLIK